jgi:hypothetical protein
MTSVWTATDEVARQLGRSPHLKAFRKGMEAQPVDPGKGGLEVESVQHLLVRYSLLQSQPLLVGKRLLHIPEFAPLHDGSADVRGWMDVAERFAFAFVDVIEFLRSRLPGYPMLLVPDLSAGAARVYQDGFWDMRFPWMAEVRRAGLQFQTRPDLPPRALELPDDGIGFYDSLADLVTALRASATWQRFEAAHAALGEDGRGTAKQLRKEYRDAVKEDRIDAIAGDTGMRSAVMRRSELAAVKSMADGPVQEYFQAFDAVDELLDGVAAFITQRLARGDIPEVSVITADWGPAADMRFMRIQAHDDDFRNPHDLVRVSSVVPALGGVMLLHDVTIFFDDGVLLADGRLLAGSHSVPSAGP